MLARMRLAALVAAVLGLAAATPPAAQAGDATGRLLVSLRDGDATGGPLVARSAARATGRVPEIGLVTLRPSPGTSARELAARLRRDPRVRAVEPERRATPRAMPDDPALTDPETAPGTPEGTTVEWWVQRTGLFEAWDVARGAGAIVGLIDSGIDGGHPEYAGKVRDAVDADASAGTGGPLTDETGHGTHVGSLACAAGSNGTGIVGAGWDCSLLVAKTDFSDSSVAQAIVEATNRGADAISMAFGTDGSRQPPTAIVDAIRYAAARNVVLVAAAADEDTEEQGDPANVLQPTGTGPNLNSNLGLTITAADHSDQRASFAGRGSQISMAAYGAFDRGPGPRGLLGAFPANETTFERGDPGPPPSPPCRCRTSFRGDTRYAYLQGTSMATGIAAGVAAMVRELNPDLPGSDVVRLLKETARRPAGTAWNSDLGWGILDARAAVERARTIDRRPPSSRLRAPRRTRRRTVRLRWSGTDTAPPGVTASGIARYEVWRGTGRRRAVRIATTTATSRRVRLRRGRRYRFFTIAVDRAGNHEAAPATPDATVRVLRRRRRG